MSVVNSIFFRSISLYSVGLEFLSKSRFLMFQNIEEMKPIVINGMPNTSPSKMQTKLKIKCKNCNKDSLAMINYTIIRYNMSYCTCISSRINCIFHPRSKELSSFFIVVNRLTRNVRNLKIFTLGLRCWSIGSTLMNSNRTFKFQVTCIGMAIHKGEFLRSGSTYVT